MNDQGQLGRPTTERSPFGNRPLISTIPVMVQGVQGAVSLAVDNGQSCALLDSGHVTCWGSGSTVAAPVFGIADGVQIVSQDVVTCVLTRSADFVCWRNGRPIAFSKPVPGATLIGIAHHSNGTLGCVVRSTAGDRADCWSSFGTGFGLTLVVGAGILEFGPAGAGECALVEGGTLRCEPPPRPTGERLPFQDLAGASEVERMDCSSGGDCALLLRSKDVAIVGHDSQTGVLKVQAVNGVFDAAEATGSGIVGGVGCARKASGAVLCWGSNGVGQLGRGSVDIHILGTAPVVGLP
jgi:hypothetical protein